MISPPRAPKLPKSPSPGSGILATGRSSSDLGSVELEILAQADRNDRSVLILPDDADLLDEVTGGAEQTGRSVQKLIRAGWLLRVRRGTFVVRTRGGALERGALSLVGDISRHSHLVTGGAALARAGLTDQSFRRIIVLTPTLQRSWSWMGETVRYVRVRPSALWGGRTYADSGSTRIARPTRALLDSVAHPSWGVTLSEVARGIHKGTIRLDFVDALAADAEHFGNALASRRIGFLVERVLGAEEARPFLPLRGRSNAIVPLVPNAVSKDGPIDSTWRLRVNVDLELLLDGLGTD
jgi:predicted transcriptional regulator of viral defense system